MFLPKKNVHLSGVTTSSLRVLLKHFAEWGTAYWRLFQFLSFATNHTAGEISNEHRVSSVIFKVRTLYVNKKMLILFSVIRPNV